MADAGRHHEGADVVGVRRDVVGKTAIRPRVAVRRAAGDLEAGRVEPAGHAAYLITGSPAGVYDPLPWIALLSDFIRAAERRHRDERRLHREAEQRWRLIQRADVVITYGDDQSGYPHPDHVKVHDISVLAWERAGDPAWYPEFGAPYQPQKLYYTVWAKARLTAIHEAMIELRLAM